MIETPEKAHSFSNNGGRPILMPEDLPDPPKKYNKKPFLISLSFIVASSLAAALFWVSYNTKSPAVVAANDIQPGSKISINDLKVIETDGELSVYSSPDQVVGKIAVSNYVSGDLIQASGLSNTRDVEAGKSVIGIYLGPGGYPIDNIAIGDSVDIFAIDPVTSTGELIASSVTVYDVVLPDELASNQEMLLSLTVTNAEAMKITAASQQSDGLRVALKGSR